MKPTGPKYANYKGNVESIVGAKVVAPWLRKLGELSSVLWVATDAVYDAAANMTRVEWDVLDHA